MHSPNFLPSCRFCCGIYSAGAAARPPKRAAELQQALRWVPEEAAGTAALPAHCSAQQRQTALPGREWMLQENARQVLASQKQGLKL
jgi:hypothetical protein